MDDFDNKEIFDSGADNTADSTADSRTDGTSPDDNVNPNPNPNNITYHNMGTTVQNGGANGYSPYNGGNRNPVYNAQPQQNYYGSYYNSSQVRQPSSQYTQHTAPTAEHDRKKKGGGLTVAIVACCLVCSLVGGALGAGGMYIMSRRVGADNTGSAGGDRVEYLVPKEDTAHTGEASTETELYYKYCNSVVGIANEGTTTNIFGQITATASSGTGFIISEDGYILTNAHVVESSNKLTVTLYNGTTYDASLIGADSVNDVAVIKIDASGLSPVVIGDSDNNTVGEKVMAIGNPLGQLTYTATGGMISATDREINISNTTINMLQTDCAINAGNSGGPLFNMYGEVIGIVSAKYSSNNYTTASIEGIGFAIPINDAMEIADDLMTVGYVTGRASFGISVQSIDSSYASYYNIPLGAYVASVNSGSAAEKAGIKVGDVITKVGDYTIQSRTDLNNARNKFKAGDTTTLEVYRSGDTISLTITFDESNNQQSEATTTQSVYQIPFGDMFGAFGSERQ